jgi:putative ABC transport system permease protein
VVGLIAKEAVLIGAASTVVGVSLGYLLTRWMIGTILADTVPDFGFDVSLSATTLLVALVVGVLAVALTPLLLIRRLRRMSIPDALRVME